MDTRTEVHTVGDLNIELVCDIYFGDYLDTRVVINGHILCTIEGTARQAFIEELTELINQYKI